MAGIMRVLGEKGRSGIIQIIIGGKDYMDNVGCRFFLGVIGIDNWCIVGIGDATGSGM
jgi:hypothetical protein